MKTKIYLKDVGYRHYRRWKFVVQGEKKKLTGRYIEDVGLWQPRAGKLIKRSIVLNKHKLRYWLSVGAIPTRGVARLLAKFGPDVFPVPYTVMGSRSKYENPKSIAFRPVFKAPDYTKGSFKGYMIKYKQGLQNEINLLERRRRVAAEAMANLGERAADKDVELVKTDDLDSEEPDIFERVKTFEELQKRFTKHRREKSHLRGNDLRYNVYLTKMKKLTRMELGLDLEGYKDYQNNLEDFAKYEHDVDVLKEDAMAVDPRAALGSSDPTIPGKGVNDFTSTKEERLMVKKTEEAQDRCEKLRFTLRKLFKKNWHRIYDTDKEILDQFKANPRSFLDYSAQLALDLKLFYEQRLVQLAERQLICTEYVPHLSKEEVEARGVSQREFAMIKKLLKLDKDIFKLKEGFLPNSPFLNVLDIAKYHNMDIPQDCKEMMFRPHKMRRLYERYWQLVSPLEKERADAEVFDRRHRWSHYTHKAMPKGDDEYKLMDEVMSILDKFFDDAEAAGDREVQAHRDKYADFDNEAALQERKDIIDDLVRHGKPAKDGFEHHAEQILSQIRMKGFCTKSQLQYLELFNKRNEYDNKYTLKSYERAFIKFFDDQEAEDANAGLEAGNDLQSTADKIRNALERGKFTEEQQPEIMEWLEKYDLGGSSTEGVAANEEDAEGGDGRKSLEKAIDQLGQGVADVDNHQHGEQMQNDSSKVLAELGISKKEMREGLEQSEEEFYENLEPDEIFEMLDGTPSEEDITEPTTPMQELEVAIHGTTLADILEGVESDPDAALPESLESDINLATDSELLEAEKEILGEKYDFFGRGQPDKAEANKLLRDIRRWTNRDKIDLNYWDGTTDKFVPEEGGEEEYHSDQSDIQAIQKELKNEAWKDSYSEDTPDFSNASEEQEFRTKKAEERARAQIDRADKKFDESRRYIDKQELRQQMMPEGSLAELGPDLSPEDAAALAEKMDPAAFEDFCNQASEDTRDDFEALATLADQKQELDGLLGREEDYVPELDINSFPDSIRDRLTTMYRDMQRLTFQQKDLLLSWVVDSMKVEVIDYLNKNKIYELMNTTEREELDARLEDTMRNAQTALFNLHQNKDEADDFLTQELVELRHKIKKLSQDLDIKEIERERLRIIRKHNQKVDMFTEQFADQESLMRAVKDLEMFRENQFMPREEDYNHVFDKRDHIDQMLESNIEHLEPAEALHLMRKAEKLRQPLSDRMKRIQELEELVDQRATTAWKHGLDYGKLYHNHSGGYSMEKLKKILQRQDDNRRKGLEMHQYLDPKQARRLDDKLRKVLRDGIKQNKASQSKSKSKGLGAGFKAVPAEETPVEASAEASDGASASESGSDSEEKVAPPETWEQTFERIAKAADDVPEDKVDKTEEAASEEQDQEEGDEADGEQGDQTSTKSYQDFTKNLDPYAYDDIREALDADSEEQEIRAALRMLMAEKAQEEKNQDIADGDYEELEDSGAFAVGELQKLVEMYQEEIGLNLKWPEPNEKGEIEEDQELEFLEQWAEWTKEKLYFNYAKRARPAESLLEKKEKELKERDPLFAHLAEKLGSTPAERPRSLLQNEWLPTPRESEKEIARRDEALHRYPHGYRHYENYHNYRTVYPDRTLQDYANDINSQITFEEFFVLAQKRYLYDAEHDPKFRYRMGFNKEPGDSSYEEGNTAEAIVRQPEFRIGVKKLFTKCCEEALTRKTWFSKVEAFEEFTDFWGTHPSHMLASNPLANTYVPATSIVPIPMFRNYQKEDPKGKELAYRNDGNHTVSPLHAPTTLKPHHISPATADHTEARALREHEYVHGPKIKAPERQYRRLSKSKQKSWKSINTPMIWDFSTVANRLSEQEEAKAIERYQRDGFIQMHRYAKSKKNMFDLFNVFEQ